NEIRGMHWMGDRNFIVCGNIVVAHDRQYRMELISTFVLNTDSGAVTMADNGQQLMICDGTQHVAYLYDAPKKEFIRITAGDYGFYGGQSVTILDNIFISPEPNSDYVYYSTPYVPDTDAQYDAKGVKGGREWSTMQRFAAREHPGIITRAF